MSVAVSLCACVSVSVCLYVSACVCVCASLSLNQAASSASKVTVPNPPKLTQPKPRVAPEPIKIEQKSYVCARARGGATCSLTTPLLLVFLAAGLPSLCPTPFTARLWKKSRPQPVNAARPSRRKLKKSTAQRITSNCTKQSRPWTKSVRR